MQLREALDDHKRHRDHETRFPGERRTTSGTFTGSAARLVHVGEGGGLRDFGYPLSGLSGVERSRFGLRRDGEVTWFDECESTQESRGDLVVTEYAVGVSQYDLTVEGVHLTRFEAETDGELLAYVAFSPEGRETRVGQLRHGDAVEVFHAAEHDFLASATGFSELRGQVPARFDEVLSTDPVELPRPVDGGRYEEERLSGNVVAAVPFEAGAATLGTVLTDRRETPREGALARLWEALDDHSTASALEARAAESSVDVPADTARADAVRTDLQVLELFSAETGLRIAGPDFDPHYVHSGGYGYTWFRDDAEISRFLLEAAERLGLDLDAWHARSARAYCDTQREDGTWPHRVWPWSGALAPGWANARLEADEDALDYQADQTGSVVAFLADALDRSAVDGALADEVTETLSLAVDGLDDTLASDGRPVACQNAWENLVGRFTHTSATFLDAYASLAATDHARGDHAADRAAEVYDAVDDLWVPERGAYALREYAGEDGPAGELDDRLDSSTLALVSAHRAYARIDRVDGERIDRLVSHVEATLDGLWRDPPESDVAGLIRFEGDDWRRREQADEKIWTVSTAWGAHAAAELGALLETRGDARASEALARAEELLSLVRPDGPLTTPAGYLPEQVFDDGTPDSATPLGWPHAIRTATVALLAESETATAE